MAPLSARAVAATLLLFHVRVVPYRGPDILYGSMSGWYRSREREPDLGSLFPKTHLSAAKRLLLRTLEYFLSVGFFCRQCMKDDPGEFMRSSRNRLGFTQPARNSAEELTEIVVSVMQ